MSLARTPLRLALSFALLFGAPAAMARPVAAPETQDAPAPVAPQNLDHGLALRGYDAVAYFQDGRPSPGEPAYTAAYKGATYRFASAAHRKAFLADPAKYAPQYGGYCALAISHNAIADADPQQWAVRDGKLYVNNNATAQTAWARDPGGYVAKGDTHWTSYPKSDAAAPRFQSVASPGA